MVRSAATRPRALLTEVIGVGGHTEHEMVLPRSLEGDVQARLMHDPEVKSSARILKWGVSIVGGLVLIAVAGHYLHWWPTAVRGVKNLEQKLVQSEASAEFEAPLMVRRGSEASILRDEEPSVEPRPVASVLGETGMMTTGGVVSLVMPDPVAGNTDAGVMTAAKRFLEASNVEERLDLVWDKSGMEQPIRKYYQQHDDGPVAYEKIVVDSQVGDIHRLRVFLSSGEERQLTIGKSLQGHYVADWASFVIYGEMSWSQFMEQRSRGPVLFRVLAVSEGFYGGAFSDRESLGCVKLLDPRSLDAKPVYGYYRKGTMLGREMDFVMRQSFGRGIPLILTLRHSEEPDAASNQVWIDERVAEGWVARGR